MRNFAKPLFAFCLAASVLVGCCDGNGVFFSGHQAGTSDPKAISDIGDVRIRVARVITARNFKILKTYAFHFSWTPEAYAKRQAAKGLAPHRSRIGHVRRGFCCKPE